MGVVLHDTGKIVHNHEMSGPSSDHEHEGQDMLLEQGVSPKSGGVTTYGHPVEEQGGQNLINKT